MTSRTWIWREASAELFALECGFRRGEVVSVAAECGAREAAGQTSVMDGTYTPGIWIEDLGDSLIVAPQFVTSLGRRHPPEPLPRADCTVAELTP